MVYIEHRKDYILTLCSSLMCLDLLKNALEFLLKPDILFHGKIFYYQVVLF